MHALHITHLTKQYKNGVRALNGIDLNVEKGDFFALLGPNGAGKSTIIGIITSLVNKTDGSVKVFDYDIDKDFPMAKRQLGVVPQEFNFSIFEKVEQIILNQAGYYGLDYKLAKQRTEKYLRKLNLWDKRLDIARNLSGGMKRRLMIARALVHEPKLLILDEPTAGVDIEIRRSMWEFLREINARGTTVILTTHYLEEAESLCKNIAIINKGEIVENTSMQKLLNKLKVATFVLTVKDALNKAVKLKNFRTKLVDDNTLEIEVDQEQDLNSVFNELAAGGIIVTSMRNKSNRLEELFLHLTKETS